MTSGLSPENGMRERLRRIFHLAEQDRIQYVCAASRDCVSLSTQGYWEFVRSLKKHGVSVLTGEKAERQVRRNEDDGDWLPAVLGEIDSVVTAMDK